MEDKVKVSLSDAHKLLTEDAVYVLEHAKGNRCHIVSVLDGSPFRYDGTCRYDKSCVSIG